MTHPKLEIYGFQRVNVARDHQMSGIVTRFAPSPTGVLHIGSARTALFNWLFARANGGTFLLRIEDTDRQRSTPEATKAILDGLTWLGLDWDGDAISQHARQERHQSAVQEMLDRGTAYRCYATQDEVNAAKEAARTAGASTIFRSPWRDADPASLPDTPYVVRLKAPLSGDTKIKDHVQGDVTWSNDTLDDLVLLRSDGSATYMLAVVVDDHDMRVTHIIRGDDHLTNAARQSLIYQALDWEVPQFAHIPLIHGPDGKKLSKRHGAVGLEEYRDQGYPAAALRNYLARLGWSHGDDEFFTDEQAKEWFTLEGIGKSAAKLDFKKLDNISGQHIRQMSDTAVLKELEDFAALHNFVWPKDDKLPMLKAAMPALKERSKTLSNLWETSYFATADRPLSPDEKAAAAIANTASETFDALTSLLQNASWSHDELETSLRALAEQSGVGLGQIMQPLRAALTGRANSPSVVNVMEILGRPETLARLSDAARFAPGA